MSLVASWLVAATTRSEIAADIVWYTLEIQRESLLYQGACPVVCGTASYNAYQNLAGSVLNSELWTMQFRSSSILLKTRFFTASFSRIAVGRGEKYVSLRR